MNHWFMHEGEFCQEAPVGCQYVIVMVPACSNQIMQAGLFICRNLAGYLFYYLFVSVTSQYFKAKPWLASGTASHEGSVHNAVASR